MPDYTANYSLIKPLDNETADIAAINQNMDAIDGLMKQNANAVAAHLADGVQHKIIDTANGGKYVWIIQNGQLFLEEVG